MSEEVKSQIKEIAYRLAFGKDEWNDFEESLNKIFSQEHQSHEKTKELSKKSVVSGYKKDIQEIIMELEALEDAIAINSTKCGEHLFVCEFNAGKGSIPYQAIQNSQSRQKKVNDNG